MTYMFQLIVLYNFTTMKKWNWCTSGSSIKLIP